MPKKCYTYDGVRIITRQLRTAGHTYNTSEWKKTDEEQH